MISTLLRWLGAAPDQLMYIGGSDILPPPLERSLEAQTIREMVEGSQQAKSTLIEHNLRLVVYIARRFESTGINLEDLISIGRLRPSTPFARRKTSSLPRMHPAALKTRS